jgi:acetyl-CoA C-acetyltransferase
VPEAVIVSTARSPIGRAFKGKLVDLRPDDLAATIVQAALDKVPNLDPHDIDDLLMGCGLPGGEQGYNLGRVTAVRMGYDFLPGTTITRYCSSSLQTTRMAAHAIKAGEGDVFISAGVEMVSRFHQGEQRLAARHGEPRLRRRQARTAQRGAEGISSWTDPRESATCPTSTSRCSDRENLARLKGVSREEMDEFAARSQHLAEKAIANGFWEREITPVTLRTATVDQGRRPPRRHHRRGHRGLKPVFRPNGLVTAGNACPLNDGAAAVVVMSDTKAAELGPHPAGPDRLDVGHRPVARDHGLRPGRRASSSPSSGPARPSTTSTCSRSTRRSPRRSSRPTRTSGIPLDKLNVTAAPSPSATRSA